MSSFFTHFLVFLSPKLLKFGENKGVKFLTNLMSEIHRPEQSTKDRNRSDLIRDAKLWCLDKKTCYANFVRFMQI